MAWEMLVGWALIALAFLLTLLALLLTAGEMIKATLGGKYLIKREMMGGEPHYMIYFKCFWFEAFHERWNTEATANVRLNELNRSRQAACAV